MILFINGLFISKDDIIITGPSSFYIKNSIIDKFDTDENGNIIITDFALYVYDNLDSSIFKSDGTEGAGEEGKLELFYELPFEIDKDGNKITDNSKYLTVYEVSDRDYFYDESTVYTKVVIGISEESKYVDRELALYEIFGKYVLNKYDIDNDFELSDEVLTYFNEIFDEDDRMKLQLLTDSVSRRFEYRDLYEN